MRVQAALVDVGLEDVVRFLPAAPDTVGACELSGTAHLLFGTADALLCAARWPADTCAADPGPPQHNGPVLFASSAGVVSLSVAVEGEDAWATLCVRRAGAGRELAEGRATSAQDLPTSAQDLPTSAQDLPTSAQDLPTSAQDLDLRVPFLPPEVFYSDGFPTALRFAADVHGACIEPSASADASASLPATSFNTR